MLPHSLKQTNIGNYDNKVKEQSIGYLLSKTLSDIKLTILVKNSDLKHLSVRHLFTLETVISHEIISVSLKYDKNCLSRRAPNFSFLFQFLWDIIVANLINTHAQVTDIPYFPTEWRERLDLGSPATRQSAS